MLVLCAEKNQPIHLSAFGVDLGTVHVAEVKGNRIRLAFQMIENCKVLRDKVVAKDRSKLVPDSPVQRDACDEGSDQKL